MFICPVRLRPLEGWHAPGGPVYPLFQGIPVLTLSPEETLAGVRVDADAAAEDVISPFLSPGQRAAPPGLAGWLRTLTETPGSICTTWGHAVAPPGPAADLRCGLGAQVLRMAALGRQVYALDADPQRVSLARDLLLGAVRTGRGPDGEAQPVPILPMRPAQVRFAIAEPRHPPLQRGRLAWVHLPEAVPEEAVQAAALLAPGGLLTLALAPEVSEDAVSAVSLGLEPVARQDEVPSVVRRSRRRWTVDVVLCLAMRRPMGAGTL